MGVYENILSELIYQSDINLALLNDVNVNMYEDDKDNGPKTVDRFTSIKDNHKNRVERYRGEGFNPPYDYFDGTQLINSLFSKIVVPVEWLKSIADSKANGFDLKYIDSLFKNGYQVQPNGRHSRHFYDGCKQIILSLYERQWAYDEKYRYDEYDVYTNKKRITEKNDNNLVYNFFKHLRNSLSHSGSGRIKFYPESKNCIDVENILFYDCDYKSEESYDKYTRKKTRKKVPINDFLAKIPIELLMNLVEFFDQLIIQLSNEIEEYNERFGEQTAGNDINFYVDFDNIMEKIRREAGEDYFR